MSSRKFQSIIYRLNFKKRNVKTAWLTRWRSGNNFSFNWNSGSYPTKFFQVALEKSLEAAWKISQQIQLG